VFENPFGRKMVLQGKYPARRNENETHHVDRDVDRSRDVRSKRARTDHQDHFDGACHEENQESPQVDHGEARQFDQGGKQEGRRKQDGPQCAGKTVTALPCGWAGNRAGPLSAL
jgi:hypothetical protein